MQNRKNNAGNDRKVDYFYGDDHLYINVFRPCLLAAAKIRKVTGTRWGLKYDELLFVTRVYGCCFLNYIICLRFVEYYRAVFERKPQPVSSDKLISISRFMIKRPTPDEIMHKIRPEPIAQEAATCARYFKPNEPLEDVANKFVRFFQDDSEFDEYFHIGLDRAAIRKERETREERPEKFKKLYSNKDGSVFAVLDGQSDGAKLYESTDSRAAAKVARVFCNKCERSLNQVAIEKSLSDAAPLKPGAHKNWARDILNQCKAVFGEETAEWIKVVYTRGDVLHINVDEKPCSLMGNVCQNCARQFKATEDALYACPTCCVPRDSSKDRKKLWQRRDAANRRLRGGTKREKPSQDGTEGGDN